MGGALLAHTMAGLLDGRRDLTRPATSFAPLSLDSDGVLTLRPFYRGVVSGRRVLLADDVRISWLLYFCYFSPLLGSLTQVTRVQLSVPALALLGLADARAAVHAGRQPGIAVQCQAMRNSAGTCRAGESSAPGSSPGGRCKWAARKSTKLRTFADRNRLCG